MDASDIRCRGIVRLSLEIKGLWRTDYIEWPLPGPWSPAAITGTVYGPIVEPTTVQRPSICKPLRHLLVQNPPAACA
jgi:hypothetical protein